jgi:hypothetical protein
MGLLPLYNIQNTTPHVWVQVCVPQIHEDSACAVSVGEMFSTNYWNLIKICFREKRYLGPLHDPPSVSRNFRIRHVPTSDGQPLKKAIPDSGTTETHKHTDTYTDGISTTISLITVRWKRVHLSKFRDQFFTISKICIWESKNNAFHRVYTEVMSAVRDLQEMNSQMSTAITNSCLFNYLTPLFI